MNDDELLIQVKGEELSPVLSCSVSISFLNIITDSIPTYQTCLDLLAFMCVFGFSEFTRLGFESGNLDNNPDLASVCELTFCDSRDMDRQRTGYVLKERGKDE